MKKVFRSIISSFNSFGWLVNQEGPGRMNNIVRLKSYWLDEGRVDLRYKREVLQKQKRTRRFLFLEMMKSLKVRFPTLPEGNKGIWGIFYCHLGESGSELRESPWSSFSSFLLPSITLPFFFSFLSSPPGHRCPSSFLYFRTFPFHSACPNSTKMQPSETKPESLKQALPAVLVAAFAGKLPSDLFYFKPCHARGEPGRRTSRREVFWPFFFPCPLIPSHHRACNSTYRICGNLVWKVSIYN